MQIRQIVNVLLAVTVAGITSISAGSVAAQGRPPGTPDVGWGGGTYDCGGWSITIPSGLVPDGGYLHCGGFNPAVAPSAPADAALLQHTINVNIYNPSNQWVTQFNPPLEVCWPYTQADLAAAGGNAARFTVQTAAVGGQWKTLPTTAPGAAPRACARVPDLSATLFDLSVTGGGQAGLYLVQRGDTLFRLATRFATTVEALRQANQLPSTSIFPGESLVIPGGLVTAAAAPAAPVVAAAAPAAGLGTYIVQRGDTLYAIATRLGTTVAALQAANGLRSSLIWPGQALQVAGSGAASAVAPAPPVAQAPALASGGGAIRVPIVEYHDSEFYMNPQVMMTTAWFESQLQWLADNQFTTLSADQLVGLVNGTYPPPQRAVVLAFDIGTSQLDNFANQVMPRLRQHQMRAIVFVLTRAINDDCSQNQLCWSLLRQWQAEGLVTIGSHGVRHPDYAQLTAAQMSADAGQSKTILEAQMGVPVTLFAFPYDSAPAAAGPVLQALGYQAAVAGNVGGDRSVHLGDSRRYALPRYYPYSSLGTYPALVGTSLTFEQMVWAAVEPR